MFHEVLARAIHADRVRDTERALRARSLQKEVADGREASAREARRTAEIAAAIKPKGRTGVAAAPARSARPADGPVAGQACTEC